MREMNASEVARHFSAVLDAVERGETIVVTRAGRRAAAIIPTPRANGAELRAVLDRWHDNPALDDTLVAHVESVRRTAAPPGM